jgi:hypothetical protein
MTLMTRIYDSTVTLAFALVTLTPSCFARPIISTRFRAETACAILLSLRSHTASIEQYVLGSIGAVMHEKHIDVLNVVYEESLVP